jgi:hypothetical protein
MRGGQGEKDLAEILKSSNPFDLSNLINLFKNLGINTEDNTEDIKLTDFPLIYRWATFINFMSNKTPDNNEEDIQVELTDAQIRSISTSLAEEIRLIKKKAEQESKSESESESGSGKKKGSPKPASSKGTIFMNLITKIFNRPSSARPSSARPPSARPPSASTRPPSAPTRPISANSRVRPSSTFMISHETTTTKEDIPLVVDESLNKILKEFDDVFKGILTVVNDACQGSSNSSNSSNSNFKNMISIVKRLPDIDTSLPN